ncbi:MAG: preprotein translocase subunit SecE [Dehalococcoidia bacterium]
MGRAARRQQERAERRQRTQPAPRGVPAATAAPTPAAAAQRRGSLLKPRWVMDIISELRKVTWPSRAETAHLTIVVIVVSLLFGVLLGGADLIFSWVVEQTILR